MDVTRLAEGLELAAKILRMVHADQPISPKPLDVRINAADMMGEVTRRLNEEHDRVKTQIKETIERSIAEFKISATARAVAEADIQDGLHSADTVLEEEADGDDVTISALRKAGTLEEAPAAKGPEKPLAVHDPLAKPSKPRFADVQPTSVEELHAAAAQPAGKEIEPIEPAIVRGLEKNTTREKILAYLDKHGEGKPIPMAKVFKCHHVSVRQMLGKLMASGQVAQTAKGTYKLIGKRAA